jgi:competence protein ComGC
MALSATIRAAEATAPAGRRRRSAFTLIELMVVTVLIISLSGLALAGMGVARQRAKIDKTKSTIRKLNEIIVPHYESYVRRRVPLVLSSTNARLIAEGRLVRQRFLLACEMPDSWADVAVSGTAVNSLATSSTTSYRATGAVRSYAAYRAQYAATLTTGTSPGSEPSSECLFMIVARGLQEPDALEHFRSDEIGDVDKDRVNEFVDGWGQPIAFIRWPVGFASPLQTRNASLQPDPFDPLRVSTQVAFPDASVQQDYGVVPLIMSGGPDGRSTRYGISTGTTVWTSTFSDVPPYPFLTLRVGGTASLAGAVTDARAARDNITNHDLTTK